MSDLTGCPHHPLSFDVFDCSICHNIMAIALTSDPTYPFPLGMDNRFPPPPDTLVTFPSEVSPAPSQPTDAGTGASIDASSSGTAWFYLAPAMDLEPSRPADDDDTPPFDDTFFDIDAASSDHPYVLALGTQTSEDTSRLDALATVAMEELEKREDTSRLEALATVAVRELEKMEREKPRRPERGSQPADDGVAAASRQRKADIRRARKARAYDRMSEENYVEPTYFDESLWHLAEHELYMMEKPRSGEESTDTDGDSTDTEDDRKGSGSDANDVGKVEPAGSDSGATVVAMPAPSASVAVADTRSDINYAE